MLVRLTTLYAILVLTPISNSQGINCTLFGFPCEGDSTACCGYPFNKCQSFGVCTACVSAVLPFNVLFLPGCIFEAAVGVVASGVSEVAAALSSKSAG